MKYLVKKLSIPKVLLFGFLILNVVFAQYRSKQLKFWDLQSLSGSVLLESYYRIQETLLKNNFNENQKSSIISGKLALNTNSYILHPNFLLMDLNLEYSPGAQRDNFLVIPDRSETRAMERINYVSTFFNGKPLSLSFFTNYTHNFINREYTSNVEIFHNNIGGSLFFRNQVVPISFNINKDKWEQNEIQSGRKFSTKKNLLSLNLQKSITKYDRHRFKYSFEDNSRDYNKAAKTKTKISSFNLKNDLYFNTDHSSSFRSNILLDNREGNFNSDRLQFNENLIIGLPSDFGFVSNYRHVNYKQTRLDYKQNNINAKLNHKLYSSIQTSLNFEYNDLDHSSYHEFYSNKGFSINYRKKIPTGTLSLSYDYNLREETRNSDPEILSVVDEQIKLDDSPPILLGNPYVLINTIVVTNLSKTIIYEENIDYIIIQQGIFSEIQRLTGGQIQNGEEVLVNYTTEKPISYDFNTVNTSYGTYITLFNNLVELYARAYSQDFNDIGINETKIFKNINRQTYGTKLIYRFATAGYEYNDYKSNIIPYRSEKFFLNLSTTIYRSKIILSGRRREHILTDTNEKQIFSDIAGKYIYQIDKDSKFKIDGGYRIQEGRQIDLDLFTSRGEYITKYRKIFFTFGFEMYRRDFSGEKINFNSVYLKIERLF